MKRPIHLLCWAALGALFLAGCTTPADVKNLAQQTANYDRRMGETHEQDLRDLAAYDRQRVVQFNRLLNEYLSLRAQVLSAFNDALDKCKRAALAELDHEFDQRADKIMTSLFWVELHTEAESALNQYLFQKRDQSYLKNAQVRSYPLDLNAKAAELVAAHNRYAAAAAAYETVEASFAEMVLKIDKARTEFHTSSENALAQIPKLTLPPVPAGVTNFTLTDNTADINKRIDDLKTAYDKLDLAHNETVRYLNENNPGGTFILAIAGGTLGVDVSGLLAKDSPPTSPADPAGAQSSNLSGVLSAFVGKITDVAGKQTDLKSTLDSTINNLLQNIRPVVKLISQPSDSNADAAAPKTTALSSP